MVHAKSAELMKLVTLILSCITAVLSACLATNKYLTHRIYGNPSALSKVLLRTYKFLPNLFDIILINPRKGIYSAKPFDSHIQRFLEALLWILSF
jgi:hypothetical protein